MASASPKLTSGPSTWRRASNARRSRNLRRKSRQTNCSNIYRWYRSSWGRYSQADPIGLRGDINLYTYSRNPIREFDPLGLLRIRRREFYIHDPSMGGLGDRGNTTPRVRITYECLPAGNCWRPEFSVLLEYTVRYRDANVRAHEEQHIVIFERDLYPLLNSLSQHEVRYATFDVCRQHARRAIANFERDINWFDFDHVIHDDGFSIFEWVATNAF